MTTYGTIASWFCSGSVGPPSAYQMPCERAVAPGQNHPRYPSGWCVACGAAPEESCRTGGPTDGFP